MEPKTQSPKMRTYERSPTDEKCQLLISKHGAHIPINPAALGSQSPTPRVPTNKNSGRMHKYLNAQV